MANTKTFKKFNINPYGKITSDCVIRSISLFLSQDYYKTLQDLLDIYTTKGYHISDPVCFMLYLSTLDLYKTILSTPISLQTLCTKIQNNDYENLTNIDTNNCDKILVLIGTEHLTFVEKGVIIDITNCGPSQVSAYWTFRGN